MQDWQGAPVTNAVADTTRFPRQALMLIVPSRERMGVARQVLGNVRRGSSIMFGKCVTRNLRLMMVQGEFESTSALSGLSLPTQLLIFTATTREDTDGATRD